MIIRQSIALFFLCCCIQALAQDGVNFEFLTFGHDEMERKYLLHLPESVTTEAPLLLVLHGYTSSAQTILEYSKFNEIADREGFAVAYPQGSIDQRGNTFWNVGYDFHSESIIDDLGFLTSLANYLVEAHDLSNNKIFLTGMSNGGDMTYLQACVNPRFFKAMAPIAGTMMANSFAKCKDLSPPPILAVVGSNDEITLFDGDMKNKDNWGAYQSTPDIVDYWTDRIDFDKKTSEQVPDLVKRDSSVVIATYYENQSTGVKFDYYKVINGGHDWPGAFGNMDINTSEKIWSFFKSYVKD